ncbi:hypothetical protein Avbf_18518 [Armadillidium vulgare]|nr:hypothetical protein Avbf_18518 [Armadillidium vulgare]
MTQNFFNDATSFRGNLKFVGDKNAYHGSFWFFWSTWYLYSFHNIGAVYLAATPKHICDIPYLKEKNLTSDEAYIIFLFHGMVYNKLNILTPSKCQYYDYDFSKIEKPTSIQRNSSLYKSLEMRECDAWVYDRNVYVSTIVSEFLKL